MANEGNRLMKQKEVAEMIGMSTFWMEQQRFKKTGIKFYKLNRAVRYKLSDVMEWIEERRQ
jgi:predicted DNA-binding transcriptional regulator AlpA